MKRSSIFKCLLFLLCLAQSNPVQAEEQLPADLDDPYTLDTVVVRADKMQIDVQELPSSATVFSADSVETRKIEKTADVFNVAPNMFFVKAGPDAHTGDSFASVRGITSFMSGAPVLGVYVDDVYVPGYEIPLFDIEKLEVLRGPQGTLYGRNSQGGIISIYTKPASTEKWEGRLQQSFSSYVSPTTMGMISGPVTDTLAVRLAGQYEYTNGFFKNDHDDSHRVDEHERWTGRGSFDWRPTDKFRLTLNLDGERYSGNYAEFMPYSRIKTKDSHNVDVDWDGYAYKSAEGISLRAEYNFDVAKLLSITSYRKTFSRGDQDMDFTGFDISRLYITTDNDMLSQELRLQSVDTKDSKLKWLLGAFLFSEYEDLKYRYTMGEYSVMDGEYYRQKGDTESKGFALFGQGVYSLGPVDITLGLRYDYEHKKFTYSQLATQKMGMPTVFGDNSNSYGVLLPKAALSWHATENIMPYVSVSRGYRGGGFNLAQGGSDLGSAYDPEYTWNYEAGIKTTWLDKKLKVNVAGFYIDWTDIQVMENNFPQFDISNAGKAVSQGVELDVSWLAAPGLEFYGTFGYTDARFTDYVSGGFDYAGQRVSNVPRYTATLGGTWRFLENFMINADYTLVGDIFFDNENTQRQDAYHLVNAKIGYEGEHWDIYLWGRNLLNEKYATRAFAMASPLTGENTWYGRPGDPLTIGMTVGFRF